jgi:hypothetical protein
VLLVVERPEPCLGRRDALLDGAHATRGVDQGLVEPAAIRADGFDLVLELARAVAGLALVGAQGVEFLITLLERVEIGRPGLREHATRKHDQPAGQQRDARAHAQAP